MLRCVAALSLCAVLWLPGCDRGGQPRPLRVYAASSLTEAFEGLKRAFEAAHPGVDVALTFAGSQVLRLQIEHGAPADVFASANPSHMKALEDAGRVTDVRTFARNELVVIVPLDNPSKIESFADLSRAKRLVIGSENVPIGAYTQESLARASKVFGNKFRAAVLAHVVSKESNVRIVRAKVELGEADAAIVYRTDAALSTRVRSVAIPPEVNVRAEYPMGLVEGSAAASAAGAWQAFVASDAAQAVLSDHGFVVGP